MTKLMLSILLSTLLSINILFAFSNFPTVPDRTLSPGTLCTLDDPDLMRTYNHGFGDIPICNRNVSPRTKFEVLERYNIPAKARASYKIDHVIPLGIGGSNSILNLFPINLSVTDDYEKIESTTYEGFINGKFSQEYAIKMVLEWKFGEWQNQH